MKLIKFKGDNVLGEVIVMAETIEEAVPVLERNLSQDIELSLVKAVDIEDIKKPTLLLSSFPPF